MKNLVVPLGDGGKSINNHPVAVCHARVVGEDEIESQDMFMFFDKKEAALAQEFSGLKEACDNFEREFIKASLEKSKGNQTQTAKALGIARTTLNSRLEALGLR